MEIKVDHRGQDPEASTASFDQPKPGIYDAVIKSANVRMQKGKKKARDIELVVQITKGDFAGSQIWDYPSFSEAAMWKMDQLLLAVGLLSKKKRTYKFKSEADVRKKLKGQPLTIRVRGESYKGDDTSRHGEYRAKIAQYMKPRDEEDEEEEEFDDLEDEEEEDEELEDEVDDDDEDEDDDFDDEDEDEDEDDEEYDIDDIKGMLIKQLRVVADDLGLDHSGLKKPALRDLIIEELGLEDEDEDEAPF